MVFASAYSSLDYSFRVHGLIGWTISMESFTTGVSLPLRLFSVKLCASNERNWTLSPLPSYLNEIKQVIDASSARVKHDLYCYSLPLAFLLAGHSLSKLYTFLHNDTTNARLETTITYAANLPARTWNIRRDVTVFRGKGKAYKNKEDKKLFSFVTSNPCLNKHTHEARKKNIVES